MKIELSKVTRMIQIEDGKAASMGYRYAGYHFGVPCGYPFSVWKNLIKKDEHE